MKGKRRAIKKPECKTQTLVRLDFTFTN